MDRKAQITSSRPSDCAKAKWYHLSAGFSFAKVFESKLSAQEKARSKIKNPMLIHCLFNFS